MRARCGEIRAPSRAPLTLEADVCVLQPALERTRTRLCSTVWIHCTRSPSYSRARSEHPAFASWRGDSEGADQTPILSRGYWPSYNVPFYAEVYRRSGYAAAFDGNRGGPAFDGGGSEASPRMQLTGATGAFNMAYAITDIAALDAAAQAPK